MNGGGEETGREFPLSRSSPIPMLGPVAQIQSRHAPEPPWLMMYL